VVAFPSRLEFGLGQAHLPINRNSSIEQLKSIMSQQKKAETRAFDAEVHQLLHLMVNSLYSNREIFLRELISNASDASDKLRFEALTNEQLKGLDKDLSIEVAFDANSKTLTVSDHGIGMSRPEVVDNLGTIARSGTRHFLESLSGDQREDARMIGQFGVGFYSAFIVAEQVTVETRRADLEQDQGVRWTSTGGAEYQLETIARATHGTSIELQLKEEHHDLLDADALKRIIRRYSNHLAFPIRLVESTEPGGAATDGDEQPAKFNETVVNDAQAIWTRPRNEVEDEEYRSFYTTLSGDPEPPLGWAHHHVEARQSYSLLLYLPAQAPFDLLINRDERHGLKLYVQRVFIMDAAEQVVPRYLRFLRGVIDSADLPLNVSREILQDNPLLRHIRATVVKRGLDLIENLANEGGKPWQSFNQAFSSILKEGVIEEFEQRERIASLLRFYSTHDDQEQSVGLDAYVDRMAEDQDAIWYITADSVKVARSSPHLEAFVKRGIEVLLLTDRIDEWLVAHLERYQDKPLKSVARGKIEWSGEDAQADDAARQLAGRIKKALGRRIGNVLPGTRLTESPACLVVDEHAVSPHLLRMLRQAGQDTPESLPDLEINPTHPLLRSMDRSGDTQQFNELAQVLLDQALLAEGGELADPAAYVRRVNDLLVSTLAACNEVESGADKS